MLMIMMMVMIVAVLDAVGMHIIMVVHFYISLQMEFRMVGIIPQVLAFVKAMSAAADVFISPSYREGFGLVVVEAESMGLPSIVTDVPGQIDAILPNETGLTCKAKDAESLKNAMITLIENSDYREKLSNAAVSFVVDNFDDKELFKYLKNNRDKLIFGR